jgi:hypothetical protein
MLKDPARQAYDLTISNVEDADETEMTFDKSINEILSEEIDADAYQHQLAYISRAKKPNSSNDEALSVNMFYQRIRVILKCMAYFPGSLDYNVEDKLRNNSTDSVLGILVLADTVQEKRQAKPMAALYDSGSTIGWTRRSALQNGAAPYGVA